MARPRPRAHGGAPRDIDTIASQLLAVVRDTFLQLRHETAAAPGRVTLHSSLDRDLGFDSLARVELLLRIERAFGVHLGDDVLSTAETPHDLLTALRHALQSGGPAAPRVAAVHAHPAVAARGLVAPDHAETLVEALEWHAQRHPERVHLIHRGETHDESIRYGELWTRAGAIAAGLQARGLEPQQAVAIMLPTCPDYFPTFFGVLLAGGIPVPIYPPARLSQIEDHVRRHAGILSNAGAALLVTVPEARALARLLQARLPELRAVVTPAELGRAPAAAHVAPRGGDIAFLQYTSGSTGNPKGVVLTHANLLANIRAIGAAVGIAPDDVIVSWLPLYHDMGLIGTWLTSLYFGRPLVSLSPMLFLARPARWLWSLHEHRGTLTAAPNFAYELCLKRIEDAELEGLDLSSCRVFANGAEQVHADTLERFQQRFARYGLRPGALTPVYGLAENSVALLLPPPGRGPRVDRVRRAPFLRDGVALAAPADDATALRFVGCGRPLPGHEVRIVDRSGRELGERREGRLQFKGPSATQGYYRNPQETARLFDRGWLETGDRAYFAGGDCFITGRIKDMIIRGGHHLHPDELEQAIGAVPGVRKGCVAVFGSPDPATGTERLVVVAETRLAGEAERAALREAVTRAAVAQIGEPPDEVVLAPPQSVLKTSSGKIRRAATRERHERGELGRRARASWWQVARLLGAAAGPELRRAARRARELAYGGYAMLLFALLAPAGWLATVLAGSPARAWAASRACARLLLRLAGIRVTVAGRRNVPLHKPSVLVCNHASYVDGLVLLATLPRPYAFVAKKELGRQFFARHYLRALGARFVERFAIRESVADAQRLTTAVAGGRSLAFFPEGTFRASAGLQPFRLGAFLTAVKTGTCVVPVALRGTRAVLRGNAWLAHPGPVTVTFGRPLLPRPPDGDAFAAAIRLRDAARQAVAGACGEPDLVEAAGALRQPASDS